MRKTFGAPGRYYQGPGLLKEVGTIALSLGSKAALVTDTNIVSIIGPDISAHLAESGIASKIAAFAGELTPRTVEDLCATVKEQTPDMIIAAGGGKGIDAGKAVAHRLETKLITLPTAASTDSPTSKNYVLYDESHRLVSVEHMPHNPNIVLVDTEVLAKAPPLLLRYGIGDALAKKFEARQCFRAGGRNMFGDQPTKASLVLAEACFEVLRSNAEAALAVAGTGRLNAAFEQLIEATILLAGLGFESGGLSIAHAMTRGLPFVPGANHAPHGFQIAYGLMVQLSLEKDSAADHIDLWNWLPTIGLPRTLEELGCDAPEKATLAQAAEQILAAPHASNFERRLTVDELLVAMLDPQPLL